MQSITVIAADDHQLFLEGLKSLFAPLKNIQLINTYNDGDSLLNGIQQYQPDVALMDISMPGANSKTIIQSITEHAKPPHLLALTMHLETQLARDLLDKGLRGYVLKESAFEELEHAISEAMQGRSFLSPALVEAIANEQTQPDPQELTNREIETLTCAAHGQSNKMIARSMDISERTVRFHLSNCCLKLNAHGRTHAIAKALQQSIIHV